MLHLSGGGQLQPVAVSSRYARCWQVATGPGSSGVQQAARQRRQSGRLQGHSQTQIAEPEVSWQTLEALFVQQDTPAWHSDLDQHSNSQRAQTQLSVQLNNAPESLKEKEERRKRQDFYANVGDAIRTLREDIPRLFMRDLACAFLLSICITITILLSHNMDLLIITSASA